MNKILMEEIVKHIFANLLVIPSSFINLDKTRSLSSKEYLLKETINFSFEDAEIKNKVWGCQISTDNQELKMLLADCSQEKNIPEYALLVKLKNAPAYGLYIVDNHLSKMEIEPLPLLACTLNGKDWMECQTYLQATFLAGMEQVKDTGLAWNKCANYESQFKLLLSFIKFHQSVYEEL